MRHSVYIWLLLAFSCRSASEPVPEVQRTVLADQAVVVSSRPEASEAGLAVLKKGGNAIDAAVTVHFCLAVVYPYAGNLGGGGFMVIRNAEGEAVTLDFREKAPAGAFRDMYLDESGEVVPGLSSRGHLAVGVPGSVAGMWEAHQKYGKLPWKDLVQPAIDLARNGYEVSQHQAFWLNNKREDFLELNKAPTLFAKDSLWQEGEILVQEDLAKSLERIRDRGREGFYQGETADLIVAEMQRDSGIISHQDLIEYMPVWREPVRGSYKNYDIIAMGPPSSGGVCLLQMLEMVEPYPLKKWGFQSMRTVHTMAEAEKRAFADRSEHLGDPDFWPVPVAGLLDSAYADTRMQDFKLNGPATSSDSINPGQPAPLESEETSHYSILDKDGNAVSITTTLNGPYGSKVVVQGAGFLLNNEMDDFSAKPGVPNIYGLIGKEANAVHPGKRMLSSMTPTIIEKDGKLLMVIGTPGGSTIITSVFQCFLNVVEFGMTMEESIGHLRFHHQWLPPQLQMEVDCFDTLLRDSLRSIGHELKERGAIGRVNGILIRPDGKKEGVGDWRRDDVARGY